MQEEAAKAIFCQLMDGVEFCHMNGIFHRQVLARLSYTANLYLKSPPR
jgi:hypothetical protein